MLGQIFTKSQNKIQDPAKLSRLVEMVNDTDWVMMGADTKGTIYEGLLEKNAEDRWRKYKYKEVIARDKTSLDIFWLKDKSLADLDNLPEPDVLTEEIIENMEAGLNSFKDVLSALNR